MAEIGKEGTEHAFPDPTGPSFMRGPTKSTGNSNMKSIFVALALLWTLSSASALECTFPADMQIQQIVDARLKWRDGSPDSMLSMSRTSTGGIRFGGVIAGGGAAYGIVAANGAAYVVGYNSEFFIQLASQGRCDGTSSVQAAPSAAVSEPSGFGNFLSFGRIDCVSSGENTGVRALRGGMVDLDDGSVSDIAMYRRPLGDLLYFKVVSRPDVHGLMKAGASVVVFTHTKNNNPRGDPLMSSIIRVRRGDGDMIISLRLNRSKQSRSTSPPKRYLSHAMLRPRSFFGEAVQSKSPLWDSGSIAFGWAKPTSRRGVSSPLFTEREGEVAVDLVSVGSDGPSFDLVDPRS